MDPSVHLERVSSVVVSTTPIHLILVGPAIGERVGVIAVCNLDDEPAASYCLGGLAYRVSLCRFTSPCHPKLLMQLVLMVDTAVPVIL